MKERHRCGCAGLRAVRVWCVTLLTLCVSACGPRDASTPGVAQWSVSIEPLLSIADDNATGEPQLGEVVGLTRLPSGGLLVADRVLQSLRMFAADGSLEQVIGREGDGPGEFRYINWAKRCGDSLFVADIGRRDFALYALDGTLGRTAPYLQGGSPAYHSACNASGLWVHNGWESPNCERAGRVRFNVSYWLATSAGERVADLGEMPGSERLVNCHDDLFGSGPHPLGKEPVVAIGRERAYVGLADSFVVRVFAIDGSPLSAISAAVADLRTTAEDIVRFKRLDTLGKPPRERAQQVREWERVEFPPTVPAYDKLLVDALDYLWVRHYPRGDNATVEWLVFSPAGELVARTALPEALSVMEIGESYIAGVFIDPSYGNHTVRVHALERAR